MEISEINAERNPSFPEIQPEPIARNLTKLARLVVEKEAHVGLALDGDADRIGIIDERGEFLNQHQVFALLCLYLLEIRGERGAMIKTLTSTEMISRLGEMFDVPVYETSVGFKYVAPIMASLQGSTSLTSWQKPTKRRPSFWIAFIAKSALTITSA